MSEDNCCKAKNRNKGSDEHSPIVLSLLDERFEGGNDVFIKMEKKKRLEIEDLESSRLLRKEITTKSADHHISNGSDVHSPALSSLLKEISKRENDVLLNTQKTNRLEIEKDEERPKLFIKKFTKKSANKDYVSNDGEVHSPTVSSLLLDEIFEGENDVFLKIQKAQRLESEDEENARLLGKEITKKISTNKGHVSNDAKDVDSPTLSSLSEVLISEGENDVLQKMQKRLESEDQESPRIITISESKKKSEKEETKESLENNSEIMGWVPGIEIPGPIPDLDPIIHQQFNLHTILDDPLLDN